jgi:diketogulonate reductase-like aldo/keto reductase
VFGKLPELQFFDISERISNGSLCSRSSQAGYRHFDTASYYGNEAALGKALKQSGLPREDFFIVSKVWNDAQKSGREAVRQSVLQSVAALDFGGYFDLFMVHWPVPGCFVDTYKELELLHNEGIIRNLGISNFSAQEYEELMSKMNNISIPPVVNQFEVSPFMYREEFVSYFQQKGVIVSSSKALYRGEGFENPIIQKLTEKYSGTTPAQIILRWAVQV